MADAAVDHPDAGQIRDRLIAAVDKVMTTTRNRVSHLNAARLMLIRERYNRAVSLLEKYAQNHELTRSDYNRVVNMGSRAPFVYFNRANAKRAAGDLRGAVSDYSECLRLDLKDAEAYFGRAGCYERLGNWKSAISDYSAVIALRPNSSGAAVLARQAK